MLKHACTRLMYCVSTSLINKSSTVCTDDMYQSGSGIDKCYCSVVRCGRMQPYRKGVQPTASIEATRYLLRTCMKEWWKGTHSLCGILDALTSHNTVVMFIELLLLCTWLGCCGSMWTSMFNVLCALPRCSTQQVSLR